MRSISGTRYVVDCIAIDICIASISLLVERLRHSSVTVCLCSLLSVGAFFVWARAASALRGTRGANLREQQAVALHRSPFHNESHFSWHA